MSQEEDDAESSLVTELRALAGVRLEGTDDDEPFEIRWGRHIVTVTHNNGSSSSLTLRAVYDDVARADHPSLVTTSGADVAYREAPSRGSLRAARPLAIALHPETYADARAVAEGSRREHQTGDQAFDTAVFIDTPTTDDAVLRAVLGPEVRGAVLSLLALGFLRVTIDDSILPDRPGVVEAYLWSFAMSAPPAERGARCLDAFARILDHLPAIAPSGEAHESPKPSGGIRVLGWVGGVGALAGIPLWWLVATAAHCTEGSFSLRPECDSSSSVAMIAAVVVGFIASWIARPALIRRFGERSGSFQHVAGGRVKVFAGCAVLTFFLVFLALLFARQV